MANPRNEIKFQINQQSAYLLDLRLKQILPGDKNSVEDNAYEITSLYFDDPSNFAYLDKINGINERVKYRLRYYNGNRDFIRLERKSQNRFAMPEGFLRCLFRYGGSFGKRRIFGHNAGFSASFGVCA